MIERSIAILFLKTHVALVTEIAPNYYGYMPRIIMALTTRSIASI